MSINSLACVQSIVNKKFGNKTIERWQTTNCKGSDQEQITRMWYLFQKATHRFNIHFMNRLINIASSIKKQRLKK